MLEYDAVIKTLYSESMTGGSFLHVSLFWAKSRMTKESARAADCNAGRSRTRSGAAVVLSASAFEPVPATSALVWRLPRSQQRSPWTQVGCTSPAGCHVAQCGGWRSLWTSATRPSCSRRSQPDPPTHWPADKHWGSGGPSRALLRPLWPSRTLLRALSAAEGSVDGRRASKRVQFFLFSKQLLLEFFVFGWRVLVGLGLSLGSLLQKEVFWSDFSFSGGDLGEVLWPSEREMCSEGIRSKCCVPLEQFSSYLALLLIGFE